MKKIRILVLIIVLLNLIYVNTFAFSIRAVLDGAKNFIISAQSEAIGTDVENKIAGTITGLASAGLAIGTIVAICAGIVIAIQNIATGAYGKANLKESLTPYVIGIVVLFAAWTIWAGVVNVLQQTF